MMCPRFRSSSGIKNLMVGNRKHRNQYTSASVLEKGGVRGHFDHQAGHQIRHVPSTMQIAVVEEERRSRART
jgi:hypothetical protein